MDAILKLNAEPAPESPRAQSSAWGNAAIVFLCAALLAGPAYGSFLHYDFSHSPDTKSYIQMADGNFDVSVTHRYRVAVPGLAKAISLPVKSVFGLIWPHRDNAAYHLRLGFFVVNLVFMSLVGWCLFRTCQAYGLSIAGCCAGVIGVLVSRWANSMASIPLVDSFHLLCVSMVFLALKTRDTRLLAVAILLGPLSKESFVFIAPLTLLFGNMRVWAQIVLYAIAGLVVCMVHGVIDWQFPSTEIGSVQNALEHVYKIPLSLRRLASPAGLGEVFTVLGLFNAVWVLALFQPRRRELLATIDPPLWFLLAAVIVQAIISTSLARMLFVAAPFWAVLLGKGFQLIIDNSFLMKPHSLNLDTLIASDLRKQAG